MFVCIVGTSRCGTSVLRELLHSHPELCIFRETHWLPKMVEFYGHQRVPAQQLLKIIEKTTWDSGEDLLSVNLEFSPYPTREDLVLALRAEFEKLGGWFNIREFHSILARVLFGHDGLWGDKTPDYGFYMNTIQSLWPKCRFIHIIRDGLATSQSMSKHPGCQLMISAGYDNWCSLSYDSIYKQYQINDLPMKSFIQSWRRRLNRIRDEASRLTPDSYIEVHYEDLLEDTASVLKKICSFIGISEDASWISNCRPMVHTNSPLPEFELPVLGALEPKDLAALFASRTNPLGVAPHRMDKEELLVDLLLEGRLALESGLVDKAARIGLVLSGLSSRLNHPKIATQASQLIHHSFLGMAEPEIASSWE